MRGPGVGRGLRFRLRGGRRLGPGVSAGVGHGRRHVSVVGRGVRVCTDSGGDQGVFLVRECARGVDGEAEGVRPSGRLRVLDDAYNPADTVQLTRQLVEQSGVFAIVGTFGTATISPFARISMPRGCRRCWFLRVPRRGVGIGGRYPWTTGWQPDYEHEARIYGQAIAHNAGRQRIGVLYQNDDYGSDYLRGLRAGLGAKAATSRRRSRTRSPPRM